MFHTKSLSRWPLLIVNVAALLLLGVINVRAQSSAITYQGRLTDAGAAADAIYDFEFRLFDSNGVQIGPVITREDLAVVKGIFTTTLDFGTQAFDGTERSLEIAVRPGASTDPFTTLAPRQAVTSTPYALRTLSAAKADSADSAASTTDSQKLGGIEAGQYVRTDDPRLVGGPPAPGSPNYIQNGTAQQPASFNVSGDGTVAGTLAGNIVSASTQFNIGANRVLRANTLITAVGIGAGNGGNNNSNFGENAGQHTTGGANAFFGTSAGSSNTSGSSNSFFGFDAGLNNKEGINNSFFGFGAGRKTTSSGNSFFGFRAGQANTSGAGNSFFGFLAGQSASEAKGNSFFGNSTGEKVTLGSNNTFIGVSAGNDDTTGNANTFIGALAGNDNTTEGGNTFIGYLAQGAKGVTGATAIGERAMVTQSGSLVLGSINGVNGSLVDTRVGIGTTAPKYRLQVNGNIAVGTPGKGLILVSPNGRICKGIALTDQGTIIYVPAECP